VFKPHEIESQLPNPDCDCAVGVGWRMGGHRSDTVSEVGDHWIEGVTCRGEVNGDSETAGVKRAIRNLATIWLCIRFPDNTSCLLVLRRAKPLRAAG
jgi:hypothetical protein